jgi:predicted nucleic acid-binding protein
MNVLVDTTVWSLALRRPGRTAAVGTDPAAIELSELIREGRARLIGPVRQEVLSGVPDAGQFQALRSRLAAFPDHPIVPQDYETAAEFYNRCRTKGIQGSHIDFLICAVAWRNQMTVLTKDADFIRYAQFLPVSLHRPRTSRRS